MTTIPTGRPTPSFTPSPVPSPSPYAPTSILAASRIAVLHQWQGEVESGWGWSPSSASFIVAFREDEQDRLVLYDTETLEPLGQTTPRRYVAAITFSPEGGSLAVVSEPDGPLLLLSAHSGATIFEYGSGHSCPDNGSGIFFTPDMRMIYWFSAGGRGYYYNTRIYRMRIPEGICGSLYKFLGGYIDRFTFSPSGDRFITSMAEVWSPTSVNWVYVWDARSGELVCQFKGLSPAADSQSGYFLVSSPDNLTQVVNVSTCEITQEVSIDGEILAFDYESMLVVTQPTNSFEVDTIGIVDLTSGSLVSEFSLSESSVWFEFSPDWRYILGMSLSPSPRLILYVGQ